jgi:hypothetical protein
MYTQQEKIQPTWHICFPHHSTYSSCRRSPYVATFHESSTGLDGCNAPEKKCSQLHLPARLSGSWDLPQFLFQHSHWSSVLKPSTCWWQATRLTRHISLACDRYVQYLLTGTNPSVLNRHRLGLPHRNIGIATALSPLFPSKYSPGPPKWPHPVFILTKYYQLNQGMSLKGHMVITWSSDNSAIYPNLHLCLAIANNLSLAIGVIRTYQKVVLMQLGYQFNSYNLMHNQES